MIKISIYFEKIKLLDCTHTHTYQNEEFQHVKGVPDACMCVGDVMKSL